MCGNGALPFVGREAIYVPARDSTEIAIRSLYSDGEFFFFPARNFTEPKLTLLVPGAGRYANTCSMYYLMDFLRMFC